MTNPPDVSPEVVAAQHIMQLSTGYIASTCIYIAVKLRVPDLLANAPRPVNDLARERGVNEDALYRVMRTLVSLGVFEEKGPRTFANNLTSTMLRSGTPGSMYDMALWMSDPFHVQVYANALARGADRGRVILLESVVAPGNQPDFAKLIDLEMLLMPGGRERTQQEFGDLFARAGFQLTRIIPTTSPLSVIEGR